MLTGTAYLYAMWLVAQLSLFCPQPTLPRGGGACHELACAVMLLDQGLAAGAAGKPRSGYGHDTVPAVQ